MIFHSFAESSGLPVPFGSLEIPGGPVSPSRDALERAEIEFTDAQLRIGHCTQHLRNRNLAVGGIAHRQDLPGHASKIFDGIEKYPEFARFIIWYQLEGSGTPNPALVETTAKKIATKIAGIRAAQAAGIVTSKFEPIELLGLVLQLASSRSDGTPEFVARAPTYSRTKRRQLFVDAVTAFVE
ncbi:hypothetical protein E3T23_10180 [Cryobacterium cheniae]|uniref:HTH-type transcriptional repressor Sco4008 C-terminal domain-containing protein n=1 Tax=Cryobacterium cheniae TaxID=1259262 RepID=A0A4R8XRF6_9MICO|nr:hypothetical protein [Cryobacterium cheniae]TFC79620.1 hypothetical protein E3T23_10180 [Cryobacterium cheniae]